MADPKDYLKVNLEKYGLMSWFVVFGLIEIIFAIIYRPQYIALGVYFIGFGAIGYFITDVADRLGTRKIIKNVKDENGIEKETEVKLPPPKWFYFIMFLIRVALVVYLLGVLNKHYCMFDGYCPN